jgi:hypothetical protein
MFLCLNNNNEPMLINLDKVLFIRTSPYQGNESLLYFNSKDYVKVNRSIAEINQLIEKQGEMIEYAKQ